ncbi:hypothetical protein VRU48_03635 [Pedobacter sp. KR3-3]|uniref:ABM domain-containing protein n=1 Tax=Pedobacter albus TaxID=3113905 RepID=A0ABU7I4D5_9SPHI|nr:hypothetical protein [Pedobacter sp. KR3-3]MEE1944186.1 hypothetical protein [Pedobacter sp. KR3-3]
MISVEVSYTVKPAFLEQNKRNISLFLADFRQLTHLNFLYQVYLKDDGLTFMHLSMYENEEIQQQILHVPSFLQFQQERDESNLDNAAQVKQLTLIGSSLRLI